MSNQENNILIIDWNDQWPDSAVPAVDCDFTRLIYKKNDNSDELFNVVIKFENNVVENRKIIKDLLENEEKDIIKFVNFPKDIRSKIYKISGKNPLKFKKELVDNNTSSVNVLVSKYDYNDSEYEISVSDSDETRTFTTDEDNEEFLNEELTDVELTDVELTNEELRNINKSIFKKLEQINNKIEKMHKMSFILVPWLIVIISSIIYMDPLRIIIESKINCN